MEIVLISYYGAELIDQGLISCVECVCHASALFSLYRFLYFHMRIAVIHQAHIVEVSFALLQHVYPNSITSVPSILCALAQVASGNRQAFPYTIW